MFREIGSITFQIQTVGRILRMPELRHYGDPLLDSAYVYTDLETGKIGIHDTAKNLIKDKFGRRNNEIYREIGLPSSFLRRVEYNDLGFSFYGILTDTFLDTVWVNKEAMSIENLGKLKSYIDTENTDIRTLLITDGKILVDIDQHTNERIYSETSVEARTEEELVKLRFDAFCREQVRPQFSSITRSYKAIIEALYLTMENYFFGTSSSRYEFQCIILRNSDFFIDLLTKAKERYIPVRRAEVEEKRRSELMERSWEVPEAVAFSEGSVVLNVKKSIIAPCYSTKLSEGESLFIEKYLETNDEILWWFRNGVKSEQFFSVVYRDGDGETQNFFPDFIAAYRDGTFGIFDPKSGFTLNEWREKHKALTAYLSRHGGKIIGWFVRIEWAIEPKIYMSESDEYWVESMTGWRRL